MWQVLFLYKYVWVLFLTVCLELIHIELSDVVAVLLNLALSVVHEDYETLLEEVCVALYEIVGQFFSLCRRLQLIILEFRIQ